MLLLDPAQHQIRHTFLDDWLKRTYPHIPLVCLENRSSNTWEIVELLPSRPGYVKELCIVAPDIRAFSRDHARELHYECTRDKGHAAKLKRSNESSVRDSYRRLEDDQRATKDYYRWYIRKTGSDHPMLKGMAGTL